MAEEIKIKIGSCSEKDEELTMPVRGRHLVSGLPVSIEVSSGDIRAALAEPIGNILDAVHHVLEQTPPELAADIYEKGIVLTGGGAMLRGLDQRLQDAMGVKVFLAEDAISCVAIGTGRFVEHLESHRYLG